MKKNDIRSVGWLHNHNRTICLSICRHGEGHATFVTISKEEFDAAGGITGINENKQLAADFYRKYGAGRP